MTGRIEKVPYEVNTDTYVTGSKVHSEIIPAMLSLFDAKYTSGQTINRAESGSAVATSD